MKLDQSEILLGSHISFTSPEYFLGTAKEALSFGENTFMFYTGAPQNSYRVDLDKCFIEEGKRFLREHNIDASKLVVHAPYIINLANADEDKFRGAKEVLAHEITRTHAFGVKYLVLHPGAHVGNGVEVGLKQIVRGLNEVLKEDESDVIICLETMAGKGSELGTNFEELAYIINNCESKDRLAVCFDTCHTHDAGYNIDNIEEILDEFDRIIGLDRLRVIHLNNSKNETGSHKDRHANITSGTIDVNTLLKYVYHPKLKSVPKILETPYINGLPPYKEEIEFIRSKGEKVKF